MIKKIFIGLFVSFLCLLGFSNAVDFKVINVGEELTIPNSSIYSFRPVSSSAGVLIGGGISKPIIYVNGVNDDYSALYFWNTQNKLQVIRGDVLYTIDEACLYNSSNYTGYRGDTVHNADLRLRCDGGGQVVSLSDYYSNNTFQGKMTSIAFPTSFNYFTDIGNHGFFCFIYDSLDTSLCINSLGTSVGNISDFPGMSRNPFSFDVSYVGHSPWVSGGGDSSGGSIVNNYLCPTVGQLLSTYGSEYNTGLCYSSSLIYSGNSVVSVFPQSIFDLFSSQSEFINYRQLYSNNCNLSPMSDNIACNNIFQGKNLQYSLLAKIPGSVSSLNLYSYCDLSLNQDLNTSTCVASGVYNTGVSREDVINSIINGDYQVVVPSSGSITSEVIGSGNYFDGDIFLSIDGIYTKFTNFFTTQTGNITGILPRYIISILLVIILFRLFKK